MGRNHSLHRINSSVRKSCIYLLHILWAELHITDKNNFQHVVEVIVLCVWHPATVQLFTDVSDDVPLIIWWYDGIFPHIEKEGQSVYEIQCGNNVCYTSRNKSLITGDGLQTIIFYGTDFRAYDVPLPRKLNQLWALIHEESPQNNFILCQPDTLSLFNFSSTFKSNSDYPLTTQHLPNIDYLFSREPVALKDKNEYRQRGYAPVVYLQSHCDVPSDRDRYVQELMKHIQIDSYGTCLHNKDFSDFNLKDTSTMTSEDLYVELEKYKFQLAFENAICEDYITEKLYRSLHIGSIPVYKGAKNARNWVPMDSVILVDDYSSPHELAMFLKQLDINDTLYLQYLDYKKNSSKQNQKMSVTVLDRDWDYDDDPQYAYDHFIPGFECFVCDQMHKHLHENKSTSRIVPANHLDCPVPTPSIGQVQDLHAKDSFHRWIQDYMQSVYQAHALSDMIQEGETNSENLWHHMEKYTDEMLSYHDEF